MRGHKGGGYVGDTLLATEQKTCRGDGIGNMIDNNHSA